MSLIFRIRQFFRGFFAKITLEEEKQVQRRLTPAQYALFCKMPVDARRHSLNVYQTLLRAGNDDLDLAVAALLHDVGKVAADESGIKLGLWMRVPLVLVESIRPNLIGLWASTNPSDGWRYALHVQLEHPRIGAEWAENAGTSATACWLILSHQEKNNHPCPYSVELTSKLAALQWADDRN